MHIDPQQRPSASTIRVLPFPTPPGTAPIRIGDAVRATLLRWAGSATGVIHPSRAHRGVDHTSYASEVLARPPHSYLPSVRYYLHDWRADPRPLFAAAQRIRVGDGRPDPDAITGAQLAGLYARFDSNRDGMLQGGEVTTAAGEVGERWAWIGNSTTVD